MAARAAGHVLLEAGDARAALRALRTARRAWQALDAPYEAAGVRVLAGLALRRLGDADAARARARSRARTCSDSWARDPDVAPSTPCWPALGRAPDGLTAREVEVLRLVAQGRTNRAIADALVISEKTVARHLANIFTKLDVPSRAGATAWAYEHGIVARLHERPIPPLAGLHGSVDADPPPRV